MDFSSLLKKREPDSHKGSYGKVLLICGSKGYTGAAALAAMGALRCGAGLVYLAVPESIYAIEAAKLWEPVIYSLPDQDGMLAKGAAEIIISKLEQMDAVLIGPGLGISAGTENVVKEVLINAECPVVLDADGINLLSKHKDVLRERKYPTILTPHSGEFQRFTGERITDRLSDAVETARNCNVIVLLKGNQTVVTDGVRRYINDTGNPGMATGGSGDLLAGIIVSLIGQGVPPFEATAYGAWLHGRAGDICAEEIGQCGMLPQDMLNVLPRLLP